MRYAEITSFLSGTFTLGTTVDFGDGYVFTVRKCFGYYLRDDIRGNNIVLLQALAKDFSEKVEELRAKSYDFGRVTQANECSEAFPEFADLDSLRDYCRYLKCLKEEQRVWTKSDLSSCHLKGEDLVYLYNAQTGYKGFSSVMDSPSGWFMANGISYLWGSLKLCSSEVQLWADKYGRKGTGYFPFMRTEECLRDFLTVICCYNPEEKDSLLNSTSEVSSVPDNFYGNGTDYESPAYKTEAASTPVKTESPNDYTIKLKGIHLNNPSFEDIKTTITL